MSNGFLLWFVSWVQSAFRLIFSETSKLLTMLPASKMVWAEIPALVMIVSKQIHTQTLNFSISLKAWLALAQEMRWQIATFGILDTSSCYRWIFTLVHICNGTTNFEIAVIVWRISHHHPVPAANKTLFTVFYSRRMKIVITEHELWHVGTHGGTKSFRDNARSWGRRRIASRIYCLKAI